MVKNFLKKCFYFFFKSNKKVQGVSAVEFIFFVIIITILFSFCINNYKTIYEFYNKYSNTLNIRKKKINEKIEKIEKEIEELD